MAKKTLKKICDFYDWDVEVVRIVMSALKFVSKYRDVDHGGLGVNAMGTVFHDLHQYSDMSCF
jgi:hypothetical protein